jgi:hypothetical protein
MKIRGYDTPKLFFVDSFKQIEILALDLQERCSDLERLLKHVSALSSAVLESIPPGSAPEQTK